MTTRWRGVGNSLLVLLGTLVAVASGGWGALALWYQLPGSHGWRTAGAVLWCVLVLALFLTALLRRSWWPLAGYVLAYAVLLAWWATIRPTGQADWADDVSHLLSGQVQGNVVTLHNVRDFTWRSDTDYDARWITQSYDLDQLTNADVVLSHWGSPAIAHAMISFGFSDGRHLVFSMEVRKRRSQAFSSIGGFFKDFETILIAAPESDLIRVRTNVRGEDDYLYPLDIRPASMRKLFLAYVQAADHLARTPEFYNTITANCASSVFRMARQLDPQLPVDRRLLLTGYLPSYLYETGMLDHRLTLAQWNARARITERARADPPGGNFSQAIRAPHAD